MSICGTQSRPSHHLTEFLTQIRVLIHPKHQLYTSYLNASLWCYKMPNRTIGHDSCPWPNLHLTLGVMKVRRSPPFELLMGYNPKAEWTVISSPVPQVTHRLEQIQEARDQACLAMRKAELGWIKDSKWKQHVYQVGDQVWLDGHNIKMSHPTAKLAAKRHRPFPIQ